MGAASLVFGCRMSRRPNSTTVVRRGSVVTKVYRVRRADGREVFKAVWHVDGVRTMRSFATYASAHAEAAMKAEQLAAGKIEAAAYLTADDSVTLKEARRICGPVPVISALQEWARARRLCGGALLPAAEAWAANRTPRFTSISIAMAIDLFIAAKERAGNEGERTYRSKLFPLVTRFGAEVPLESLTPRQLDDYLAQFADGVTRNDFRKRAVTLWRWARDNHHLPENAPLAIERTLRAKEKPTEIGIIDAVTYGRMLVHIRARHSEYLAPLVLAGFCGIRADEIHGKRADRERRQTWEDVHLDKKFVRVTVAKTNTPAWRNVPLCPAAIEWLMLCPNRKGPVCEAGAMEKVRLILKEALGDQGQKLFASLPENCFRHSFISHRIALTGNKPATATESGNSVKEIDRRYRVPLSKEDGQAWFEIRPIDRSQTNVVRISEAS